MNKSPYFQVILATLVWSISGPALRWLNLPPTTSTFVRLAVPTLILGLYLKDLSFVKKASKTLWAASAINGVRSFLIFAAFAYTSISNTYILFFTWSIFASIFGYFLLGEKISRKQMCLLFLPFIGVVLIYKDATFSFANSDFIGMISATLAAITYGLSIILFKKETKENSTYETVFLQNLVGMFFFIPFLFMYPMPTVNQAAGSVVWAFLVGVVGFVLFFNAIKQVKASVIASIAYLEVVIGIFWGYLLFNESLTSSAIIGALLIICSTYLLRKEAKPVKDTTGHT